ncbi:MAG TPA: SH3 domain-containing protein [Woeseiaceae bacterium]|nr:SH3 domain-containing protein [Woeseiaceae bacterium]
MRILLLFLFAPLAALADSVVPIDKVENSVNVRLSPDATSEVVGKLSQGSSAELIESIDGWHEIRLEGGATGFISADWSRVIIDDDPGDVGAVADALEAVMEPIIADTEVLTQVPDTANDDIVDEPITEEVVAEVADDETAEPERLGDSVPEPEPEPERVPVEVEAVTGAQDPGDQAVELKGTRNFLVKFRDETEGGNSQVYDNGNRVGIGTTEPKQRLEVNGSIQIHEQNSSVAGLMITQSSGDTGYIMHNRASTLTIGAGSQDRITIDREGNVGIAVARPDHPLELASGAHVTAGGVWINSSSRERKENIEALSADDALLALMALDPVVFNYREEQGEDYVGFIAEDVPALVANRDRDALSAMDIVAVLTRVVQEQQTRIRELEERLDSL